MKKIIFGIILILLIVIIINFSVVLVLYIKSKNNQNDYNNLSSNYYSDNTEKTLDAVVIKVEKLELIVGEIRENNIGAIYVISKNDYNVEYKMGQEIKVLYAEKKGKLAIQNHIIDVKRIEILKEKSDIVIPEKYLIDYYSSKDNIETKLNKLTCSEISFDIYDKNKYPYNYAKDYRIIKYNEEDDDSNFQILKSISNNSIEDTMEIQIDEGEMTKHLKYNINWKNIFGELEKGRYKFTLQYDKLEPLKILSIQFLVKENNEIEIKDYEVGKNEIKIQK